MSVFNQENDEWKSGKYNLFLGQAPGLYDSINVTHPKLFKYYKDQKSADWSEDEIDLEQSRIDMLTCRPEAREIMLENLALQWETDSFAARSIAPLFAPFVTNSEYWAAILKISEIEVLHALTYSEIMRVCMENPKDIFGRIMKNDAIISRLEVVSQAFQDLRIAGAKYVLGIIDDEGAYPIVMRAVVALYYLERLQFVDSFAATFGVVEGEQCFQGIGKLVQKIMQDERFIHAEVGKYVIKAELATERGKAWFAKDHTIVYAMLEEVVRAEYEWNSHLFSNGRKCVGFTEQSGLDWIDYNAQEVYEVFGFEPPRKIVKNPLKYMENWLDLNKTQNANQEGDQANYRLNIIVDDLGDKIIEWSYR
jgi:ribonucleoside-diphosphate reductase beta chain